MTVFTKRVKFMGFFYLINAFYIKGFVEGGENRNFYSSAPTQPAQLAFSYQFNKDSIRRSMNTHQDYISMELVFYHTLLFGTFVIY